MLSLYNKIPDAKNPNLYSSEISQEFFKSYTNTNPNSVKFGKSNLNIDNKNMLNVRKSNNEREEVNIESGHKINN